MYGLIVSLWSRTCVPGKFYTARVFQSKRYDLFEYVHWRGNKYISSAHVFAGVDPIILALVVYSSDTLVSMSSEIFCTDLLLIRMFEQVSFDYGLIIVVA